MIDLAVPEPISEDMRQLKEWLLARPGDIVRIGRQAYRMGEETLEPISHEQAALLEAAQRGANTWAKWEQRRRLIKPQHLGVNRFSGSESSQVVENAQ